MEAALGTIDIEGKNLTCSGRDIEKLTTPEGCDLKLVTDKVYSLDDGDCSDQEEYYDDDMSCLTNEAKLERMKREFISLSLNSNRDPLKPGTESRLRKFILDDNEDSEFDKEMTEYANLDDDYSRIHKRYKKLGKYEDLIGNKDKPFQEISPGRVFKRKLNAGFGSIICEESLVIYNCAFWNETFTDPYDSTWLRHNTIITDLSGDSILPGLKELLLTMKNGEWCEAFIQPEAAFGPLGAPPRIPPNATIFCLLEVVRVIHKDKISMLLQNPREAQELGHSGFEDFYEASNVARMRGNHYFDRKQYKVALQRYKSGMRILEAMTYKDEEEEKKAMSLLLKLYNNSAKAANSANIPRLALSFCKQALLINDKEPKTYWHRLVAWKNKGHLDRALGTAKQAMQLFDDQTTFKFFQREAESLKKRIQKEKVDLADLHRLMGRAITA